MILAGGRVNELSVLTASRPKSAVPVWGMYRFIDFTLSNLMHSGIDVAGVLSQYRPYSLNGHLGDGSHWDFVGRTRELRILSPFRGAADSDWYKGTADAVWQNLNFARRFEPELVLIASGDHILRLDYREMIRQHLATRAALTIAFRRVPTNQAHRFGTAILDEANRVLDYQEKAKRPTSDLASLTAYVFDFPTLAERLRENAVEGRTRQIYDEVIPRMVREGDAVYGYRFSGYWQYARTLDDYYAANMDILGDEAPPLDAWQVRTNLHAGDVGDLPPALFRKEASVAGSLVGPGATVEGMVERSVLSPGVIVERGAVVRDSIVMNNCRIERGALLDRAILDKSVTVGAGARVGVGEATANAAIPASLACGATVIGKGAALPEGIEIGRGCVVHPEVGSGTLPARVPAGTTVAP